MIDARKALATRAAQSVRHLMCFTALSSLGLSTLAVENALGQTAPPATPPADQAPATKKSASSKDQNEIVVTGRTVKTDAVSSIPVPLIDTTQSVTVLTQEEIQLSGITNWNELGRVESGGYEPGSRGGFTRSYYRGFADSSFTNNAIKIDGFRSDAQIIPEFFLYDSIQVIKGSAATNFGVSDVGGTTVAISKSPKATFGGSASVEAGSYDHYLANVDIYGPLTDDGKLSARFVGVTFTELSPFDYLGERRYSLSPSVRYKVTDNDELLFLFSYSRSEAGSSLGFPLALNVNGPGGASNQANYTIPAVKYSELGDSAPWARIDKNYLNTSLTYSHTFKGGFWDGWKLKIGAEHNEINTPDSKWAWVGAFNTITTNKSTPTNIYLYWGINKNHQWAGEINLLGDVQALGHTQTFSIGGDYTQNTQGYHPYVGTFVAGSTYGFNLYQNNWNVLPGNYTSTQQFINLYGGPTFTESYDVETVDYGEEAQLLLRPIDNLTINLGGRFSMDEEYERVVYGYPEVITQSLPAYTEARPDEHAFTYQTGATYALPVPKYLGHVNGYVSYGTTFDAGNAYAYNPAEPDSIGTFLGTIKGRTYEGGVKGDSATSGSSYNWSLDYFDTALTNAFQQDPAHPRFEEALGAQQATGWEFEFHGKPLPGWVLLVSASQTWNIYTAGALKGVNSPFAPRFGLSTWSTYEFQSGPLKGFGFGGGWVNKLRSYYETTTNGLIYRTAFRTHVDEVDARIFYDMKPWLIDLSVTNIMDERYASAEATNSVGYYIFENLPMMALLKITRSF